MNANAAVKQDTFPQKKYFDVHFICSDHTLCVHWHNEASCHHRVDAIVDFVLIKLCKGVVVDVGFVV